MEESNELSQNFGHMTKDSAVYKNLIAIRDYSKDTRELVRDLETQVIQLKDLVIHYQKLVSEQSDKLAVIQAKLYKSGT